MFSRIGDCIKFQELNKNEKEIIINDYFSEIIGKLKEDEKKVIEGTNIKCWFLKNVDRYDNIRILKNKIESAIFGKLTEEFIFKIE